MSLNIEHYVYRLVDLVTFCELTCDVAWYQ